MYSRLTLQENDVWRILPGARVQPPIERGDLLADISRRSNVVVIVDGRFHQAMAVSPAEIMDALRCGIRVYGAASMGALRAAELDAYGMIGCGRIYEFIKHGGTFRDDFVGQAFDPATGRAASAPFIDILFNLDTLVRRGAIDRRTSGRVSRMLAGLHYADRTLASLTASIRARYGHDPVLIEAADRAFRMGSQKRRDALMVLRRVRSDLESIQRTNGAILRSQRATRGVATRRRGQPCRP